MQLLQFVGGVPYLHLNAVVVVGFEQVLLQRDFARIQSLVEQVDAVAPLERLSQVADIADQRLVAVEHALQTREPFYPLRGQFLGGGGFDAQGCRLDASRDGQADEYGFVAGFFAATRPRDGSHNSPLHHRKDVRGRTPELAEIRKIKLYLQTGYKCDTRTFYSTVTN